MRAGRQRLAWNLPAARPPTGSRPFRKSDKDNGATPSFLANVQDEPRPWPARLVLLGARGVTAMVVGSGALLGFFFISMDDVQIRLRSNRATHPTPKRPENSAPRTVASLV